MFREFWVHNTVHAQEAALALASETDLRHPGIEHLTLIRVLDHVQAYASTFHISSLILSFMKETLVMTRSISSQRSPRLTSLFRILAVVVLMLVSAGPASAHAELVRSEPAVDAVVATAPAQVLLYFSQLLEPVGNRVTVMNAAGTAVGTGEATVLPNDAKALTIALQPALGQGRYTVQYTTLSAEDGEEHSGQFAFTVGAADGSTAPATGSSPSTSGSGDAPTAPAPLPATGGIDTRLPTLLLVASFFLVLGYGLRNRPAVDPAHMPTGRLLHTSRRERARDDRV